MKSIQYRKLAMANVLTCKALADANKLAALLKECNYADLDQDDVVEILCDRRLEQIDSELNAIQDAAPLVWPNGPPADVIDGLAPPTDDDEPAKTRSGKLRVDIFGCNNYDDDTKDHVPSYAMQNGRPVPVA
jgi:hypothetical protein